MDSVENQLSLEDTPASHEHWMSTASNHSNAQQQNQQERYLSMNQYGKEEWERSLKEKERQLQEQLKQLEETSVECEKWSAQKAYQLKIQQKELTKREQECIRREIKLRALGGKTS